LPNGAHASHGGVAVRQLADCRVRAWTGWVRRGYLSGLMKRGTWADKRPACRCWSHAHSERFRSWPTIRRDDSEKSALVRGAMGHATTTIIAGRRTGCLSPHISHARVKYAPAGPTIRRKLPNCRGNPEVDTSRLPSGRCEISRLATNETGPLSGVLHCRTTGDHPRACGGRQSTHLRQCKPYCWKSTSSMAHRSMAVPTGVAPVCRD
jgi:hypothetical protein